MDASEIKRQLKNRAEEFVQWLFPHGKRKGNDWHIGDITGKEGDSLRIAIRGAKTGVFADFAGDCKGDNLLELLIQARGVPFRDALPVARDWLGIKDASVVATAQREYKVPSRKGLTRIVAPVEFYLMSRGISQKTVSAFKIASDAHQNIVMPFLARDGTLEMLKFTKIERGENGKKESWTNEGAKKVLFGKHLFDSSDRTIVISEGEIDAMSWREAGIKACSVPFGAKWKSADGNDPNAEWIENDWEFLQDFERVYLCFDEDEPGRKARECVLERLGVERCWLIELPEKDANDVLVNHGADALKKAYASAKQRELENLRNAAHYEKEVEEMMFPKDIGKPSEGLPMPWKLWGGEFHWRMNEVTVITGFNGSGKTVLLNWLLLHFAKLDHRSFVASLEVPPAQNVSGLVSQCVGDRRPETPEHLHAAIQYLAASFWFYDHQGQLNRKDLIKAMEYSFRRYGTTFFVIDSLMKLGLAADDWNGQKKVLDELTEFSKRLPVHIFLVAHSKKKDDEGARAGKMDVKGAGEITDLAHNVWTVFRNKKKERTIRALTEAGKTHEVSKMEQAEPDCYFSCEKQRNGLGQEPECKLWFDLTSKQFSDAMKAPEIIVPDPPDEQSDTPTPLPDPDATGKDDTPF